jgi:hypothetical protein
MLCFRAITLSSDLVRTYGNFERIKSCTQRPVLPQPNDIDGSVHMLSRSDMCVIFMINGGNVRHTPIKEKVERKRFHAAMVYFQFQRGRFSKYFCPATIRIPYIAHAKIGTHCCDPIQYTTGTGSYVFSQLQLEREDEIHSDS